MFLPVAASLAVSVVLAAAAAAPDAGPTALKLDGETQIGAATVVCTGIGQTRADPRWLEFPIRLEFSDAANTYLAGEEAKIRAVSGPQMLNVTCEGPWILLRLPQGAYQVEARILNSKAKPRSTRFSIPVKGQQRVVLQFPDT
jgi:hypothetical protein